MAKSNPILIKALRETADRLSGGAKYEWGHMGRCNCGHLVQTITEMSAVEIVASIDHDLDEWTEHANDYCEGTNHKVNDLFETLKEVGFDYEDIKHLEYLSDKQVLDSFAEERTYLRHNDVNDVIRYMEKMADLLEEELKAPVI